MDITQLSGVSSDYLNTFAKKEALVPGDDDSFSAVLSTAMKSVDETNDLQNTAESEDRKSTRLNSSHSRKSRMPSSA